MKQKKEKKNKPYDKTLKYKIMILFKCVRNYFFCLHYPFIRSRNVWTGKPTGYYSTWYEDIPKGWRIAFGKQFLKDMKKCLKKNHELRSFRFHEIKEKWGRLCLYCGSATEETHKLLEKYGDLSEEYCYFCGKPTKYLTQGYELFLCEECFEKEIQRRSHYLNTPEKIEKFKEECKLK